MGADMAKVMNNTSNNMMQQNSMPQIMNVQSNLPPYMQKELNKINPNLMQGQMNGMPMNSAMLDQGMPMNSAMLDQGMQMPMQAQMAMQAQMPMQGNLPNLNQNQVNNILSKLPPNYNGPIDMIGGSNEIELEYALNDNMSSGQKKKLNPKKMKELTK